MVKKNKISDFLRNPSFLYICAWCLYYMQGILYAKGSIFAQLILLSLILTSLNHGAKIINKQNKPIYFKGLNILLLMFTFYGLLLFITDGFVTHGVEKTVPSMYYLKGYYISLLPIYSCYYYTKEGKLTPTVFSVCAILFVLVGIASYYQLQREALEELASLGSNRDEVTNNAGYVVLAVLPSLLVLSKKPVLQYVCIGICVFFVILAMKRGAILCAGIFLIMFTWHKMSKTSGTKRVLVIFAALLGLYLLTSIISKEIANSDYFQLRIEQTLEGESSGRNEIYQAFFNHFINDANVFNQLFGYGANGTIKLFPNYAHNDWLEILTNQGLLGIVIFLFYCLCFTRTIKSGKYQQESKFALLVFFLLFITQTFFSAGITNTVIYNSSLLGFALADGFRRKDL